MKPCARSLLVAILVAAMPKVLHSFSGCSFCVRSAPAMPRDCTRAYLFGRKKEVSKGDELGGEGRRNGDIFGRSGDRIGEKAFETDYASPGVSEGARDRVEMSESDKVKYLETIENRWGKISKEKGRPPIRQRLPLEADVAERPANERPPRGGVAQQERDRGEEEGEEEEEEEEDIII